MIWSKTRKPLNRAKKYGIYNTCAGEFQFTDICEDTKGRAMRKLFKKIGNDARKWRFVPKEIPERKPKKHRKVNGSGKTV